MFKHDLADKIQSILMEERTYLRPSNAAKILNERPEVIAETFREMKQIRPELFDVIMSNELIITMNHAYAYEATTWKRNGGFTNHVQTVKAEKDSSARQVDLTPVFTVNQSLAIPLDHEWVNSLAIISVKICAIAVAITLLFWYFDKY